jgi:hypothetical protein
LPISAAKTVVGTEVEYQSFVAYPVRDIILPLFLRFAEDRIAQFSRRTIRAPLEVCAQAFDDTKPAISSKKERQRVFKSIDNMFFRPFIVLLGAKITLLNE